MIRDSNSRLSLSRMLHRHLRSLYPQCSFKLRRKRRRGRDVYDRSVWLSFLFNWCLYKELLLSQVSVVPRILLPKWKQTSAAFITCRQNLKEQKNLHLFIQFMHYSSEVLCFVSPVVTAEIKPKAVLLWYIFVSICQYVVEEIKLCAAHFKLKQLNSLYSCYCIKIFRGLVAFIWRVRKQRATAEDQPPYLEHKGSLGTLRIFLFYSN